MRGTPGHEGTRRSIGLREMKKRRTRKIIQTEAIRLSEAKGYAETTIAEIAAAAEVSPRTFSRYFASKEDVVLWDEFVAVFFRLLDERPDGEPLARSFREALRAGMRSFTAADLERMQHRMRLIYATPALRERGYPQIAVLMTKTTQIAARRLGISPVDHRSRVLSGALVGGLVALVEIWQEGGGAVEEDLLDSLFEALDFGQLSSG